MSNWYYIVLYNYVWVKPIAARLVACLDSAQPVVHATGCCVHATGRGEGAGRMRANAPIWALGGGGGQAGRSGRRRRLFTPLII